MPDNAQAPADEVHVKNAEHVRAPCKCAYGQRGGREVALPPSPTTDGRILFLRPETKTLVIPYTCQQVRLEAPRPPLESRHEPENSDSSATRMTLLPIHII